jgi:hypothetical protein
MGVDRQRVKLKFSNQVIHPLLRVSTSLRPAFKGNVLLGILQQLLRKGNIKIQNYITKSFFFWKEI